MDYDSSTKFISSLAKFLQSLCNGYVEFDNGVEVIGHIYLSVDTGKKIDYILNEKVCKTDENSVTFISNSFHAQPAEKPKPGKKGRSEPEEKAVEEVVELDNDNQIEAKSTNSGTIPQSLNRNINSPTHRQGKRPFSPHSKRVGSPGSKKGRNDFLDHGPGISEDSPSASAVDPLRGHPAGFSSETNYPQSYDNGFNQTADNSLEGNEDRDIKPSFDTDVTFVKEEYTSSQIEDERNQSGDASYSSIYRSDQSYAGGGGAANHYGQQNSSRVGFGGSGENSDLYDPGLGTSQMERSDGRGDQSGLDQVSEQSLTTKLTFSNSFVDVSHKKRCQDKTRQHLPSIKTPSKWTERQRNFQCSYCGKSFVVRRDLIGHMNSTHLKQKPYHCSNCQTSFCTYPSWKRHEKMCFSYSVV